MKLKHLMLYLGMLLVAFSASAQKQFEMNIRSSSAPNSNGDSTDTAKVFIYLPSDKAATRRAVVICPGGGYVGLAMDHEGKEWAPFFNNMGIAAIVLK